jgi:hypothetical protein
MHLHSSSFPPLACNHIVDLELLATTFAAEREALSSLISFFHLLSAVQRALGLNGSRMRFASTKVNFDNFVGRQRGCLSILVHS